MAIASSLDQLCTFRLGPLYLGIDVLDVREVLHHADVTSVPHADNAVEGLINLRGQIATTIDLRRRLNIEKRDPETKPIHVVILSDGEPVTLLVDAIGDVIDVDPQTYEEPPSTMTGVAKDLILGAYKLDDELLLVLDVQGVVDLQPISTEQVDQ
ncbi:MAG: purine-binding chemotaxis protein CheW [Actinomycetia bacterium]|nr:purine-binding chemotaxis protein CheW [Actinomycetes bacterium]MCP4224891.1 purine-binding chemotaxis protein CheW [Actinomycetes bacterium]MCP5035327.1 purine-binding chemotaxis protein CheW [Actinomycetes bacterium]